MKVVSNDGLTKLVELVKDNFIKNTDIEATGEVTLATVATSGQYSDLTGTPTIDQTYNASSTNAQSGTAVAQAVGSVLPTQSGQSGKFLTTNGTSASWATVDALPSQSGQNGKFLSTDGTTASWASLPEVDQTYDGTSTNAQSGTAVKEALEPVYKIAGNTTFSSLPNPTESMIGNVYNITDAFTSDSKFLVSGKQYSAGTNAVVVQTLDSTTYYGFYSNDDSSVIYVSVNPFSISYGDTVYQYDSVNNEMNPVGSIEDCYADEGEYYSYISSWRTDEYEYYYPYANYDSSYNITITGTTPIYKYDTLGGENNSITINPSDNYVPYRSSSTVFSNSTLLYNSSAMAFNGKLHVGSSSPSTYASKGKLTIYDNTPSQQVSSIALLNYGGGGGCGVAIDMYNTSANGGIPSGRFGLVDNGNYSGYLQLQVKKSGSQSNPLLTAMNVVPVPAANSLTTCISFGQDEFNRVLFDLHKPEATCTITDTDKRWGGSGTTYQVTGSNKFNSRLLVAVGDIVSFDNFATEATVTGITSNSTTLQITTNQTLGTISNKNIAVKKAYMKITDENNNIKVYVDPYGKFGIGTGTPGYELDVAGSINASTDVKINGVSVALPSQSGNSGKYLTTNGTSASWADIPEELPSQSGQSGKFLTTNGTSASWGELSGRVNYKGSYQSGDTYNAGDVVRYYSNNRYMYYICTTDNTTSAPAYNALWGKFYDNSINFGTYSGYYPILSYMKTGAIGDTISQISGVVPQSTTYYDNIPEIQTYTGELRIKSGGITGNNTSLGNYTIVDGSTGKIPDARLNNPVASQTGNSGKFLTTNGTDTSWADVPSELPSQTGQSGKVLTTNGTSVSWTNFPEVDQTYSGTSTNAQSGVAVKSAIDSAISSVYKPAGSVAFANLPTLSLSIEGYVYNVSDAFTTTNDFVEGAGKSYPAGTNVVCINTATSGTAVYKWDVLSGMVDLSGYQTLIDSTHKLSADLVDDTNTTNKFVTATDITNWNGKVDANSAITGATKCKITYDSKGLVTSGADLSASDIPSITLSKISDITATASEVNVLDGITASTTELNYVDGVTSAIQTQLNNKVESNTAITGATKCKITYDSKGLVTSGADLSASDIPDLSSTYQTKITSSAKLSADLVDDTNTTNKFVTASDKSAWSGKQDQLVSGTNIKTINSTSLLGSGDISITGLPSQTSQSGKFLTTNGTTASWADVPTEIPTQTGQSGKFLTTNGSTVSWADVPTELPSQSGNSGKFLTTNGSAVSWASISVMTGADGTNAGTSGLTPQPAATDNTKYLKGDGTWSDVTVATFYWGE